METLKKMIEDNAESRRTKILNELEKINNQVEKILDKNYQETISKMKEIEEEYTRKIETLKKMIVSNAEIQVKNELLRLYSEYVDKAIELALEELIRDKKRYHDGLSRLFLEAVNNIGEKNVIVYCNPADRKELEKIAKRFAKESGIEIEIREQEISKYGGVIATNGSGSIVFNNTIEARLMRIKEDIRKVVGEVLRK